VLVVRIFTDKSISPSLSLRQRPDRYAFRAGRNLLDNEFRLYMLTTDFAVDRTLSYTILVQHFIFKNGRIPEFSESDQCLLQLNVFCLELNE